MANFRDINGASRQMNRVTDIELEAHNRSALESVMVCHAATGRVQEMAVSAQTLEKTSREADIAKTLADLNLTIAGLKQAEPVEVMKNTEKSDIGHALTSIAERLDVLEGK